MIHQIQYTKTDAETLKKQMWLEIVSNMGQGTPRDSALSMARPIGIQKDQPLEGHVQVSAETAAGPETTKEWQIDPRYQAGWLALAGRTKSKWQKLQLKLN